MTWTKQYAIECQEELDKVLDLMEEQWGFRPNVTIKIENIVRVKADFNLKGFQHEGRTIYVSEETSKGRRKPKQVIRSIASELTSHRNTCKECGENVPALWRREYTLRRATGEHSWHGWYADQEAKEQYIKKEMQDARVEIKKNQNIMVEPDLVERTLHPILSKRILVLQGKLRAQLKEEEAKPLVNS